MLRGAVDAPIVDHPLLIAPDISAVSSSYLSIKCQAMARSELIASLTNIFPQLVRADAEMAVAEILGAVGDALGRGDRVEIHGFGSFCLNYRPPRLVRNQKTGAPAPTPGKHVPSFKAGEELHEVIDSSSL